MIAAAMSRLASGASCGRLGEKSSRGAAGRAGHAGGGRRLDVGVGEAGWRLPCWGSLTPLPDPNLSWPIRMAAVALVAEAEGCVWKAYRRPAGVWTIARGRTTNVKPGDTCTQEQADQQKRGADRLRARRADRMHTGADRAGAGCDDEPGLQHRA